MLAVKTAKIRKNVEASMLDSLEPAEVVNDKFFHRL